MFAPAMRFGRAGNRHLDPKGTDAYWVSDAAATAPAGPAPSPRTWVRLIPGEYATAPGRMSEN